MQSAEPIQINPLDVLDLGPPSSHELLEIFRQRRSGLLGVGVVAATTLVALLSTRWTPYPTWKELVGLPYGSPTFGHPLGFDAQGRDVLSRLMAGSTTSMEVGIGALMVVLVIGVAHGLAAGYFGGLVDLVLTFILNLVHGIPPVLIAITMSLIFGRNTLLLVVAIALGQWMGMARLVRGQTIALREREYIQAALVAGAGKTKVLQRHILPNILGPVIVQCSFIVPQAILTEAFLSFLGLGVPPPTPTWGGMIAEGYQALSLAPHIALAPTLALTLLLVGMNWIGDALRDAADPRLVSR